MTSSLKNRIAARQHDGELDSADVVQTVILIAGFVIVAILLVTWLGTAILNKSADAGACVQDSNTYAGGSSNNSDSCAPDKAVKGGTSDFRNDGGYKSRYN